VLRNMLSGNGLGCKRAESHDKNHNITKSVEFRYVELKFNELSSDNSQPRLCKVGAPPNLPSSGLNGRGKPSRDVVVKARCVHASPGARWGGPGLDLDIARRIEH
jgi:hypothetical protein